MLKPLKRLKKSLTLVIGGLSAFSLMALVGTVTAQAYGTQAINHMVYPSVGTSGENREYMNSTNYGDLSSSFTNYHIEDYSVPDSQHVTIQDTVWEPTVSSGDPYYQYYWINDAQGNVTYFSQYDGTPLASVSQIYYGIGQTFSAYDPSGSNLVATSQIHNMDATSCYYNQGGCVTYVMNNGWQIQ